MTDLGLAIAQLQRQVAELVRQSRLSSASLDDTSLVVRDGEGSLRGIVGQQGDGTTAVNIVNGPPPPSPSAPVVASVLGGISAGWDGTFADGAVIPMDWARIEVHASPDTEFTPTATTLQATVETAQGATVVIPTDNPLYVRLVARSTSGTASTPSAQAGPYGPAEVVATDILDGIVTTLKLADDAVTSAKLAVAAVDTTALADGAVLTEKLADAAVAVGKIADNAVTGPAIAADAVTAGKISADAVTAREIAAGSVTTAEVAAGAITTDKLTVTGGTNILADPSFEGPATEALVASVTFWSIDPTKGNGSSKSLLVDATAGAVTNRQITLATIAVIPGDQVYLAFDYQTSPDYNGTRVRFYARWHDAAGGTLGYTIADSGAPPVIGGTGWSRPTATGTAPPDATRADIVALSLSASTGFVWFDNAVLRTVVGGTQIQDGAITTAKIVAGAIQTAQLDAEAVNASKIAAGAVTTAKLDALAVTTDKLNANAVTVGKLAAGSVDATALKADAITGKTITGGTINGADFHSDNGAGGTVDIQDGSVTATGASGWKIQLSPNASQPTMGFLDSEGDEAGTLLGSGNDALPNMGIASGPFTDPVLGECRWLTTTGTTSVGNRVWTRRVNSVTYLQVSGGEVVVDDDASRISYVDTADSSHNTYLSLYANHADLYDARLTVKAPPSTFSALYVSAETGHTGALLLAQFSGANRFTVTTAGAATAAASVTAPAITATGALTGNTLAITDTTYTAYTPTVAGGGTATFTSRTGWYHKIGRMVFFSAQFVVNAAGSGAAAVTITAPSSIHRTTRQIFPCHSQSTTTAGAVMNGHAISLETGTGTVIDRISLSNDGASNRDNILNGANLLAGAQVSLSGWYREA